MSRKQFKVAASSHEKKLTKKQRRAQQQDQPVNIPQEEILPTEEDTVQIKNLALYSCIGIGVLLCLMYWIFISSQ